MSARYFEDEDTLGKIYDRKLLGRLSGYLKPYISPLAVTLVIVIITACLQIAGPLIVREAIDSQIQFGRTDGLPQLVAMYVGVLVGIFVLEFAQTLLMTFVGQRVMMDLRIQLFGHIQRMAISFFDRNPVGRLVTRLTNDISTLEQMLSFGTVETLMSVFRLVAIIGILLVLDVPLALLMLLFVPPLVAAVRHYAFAQRESFREQRTWLSRINSYLNENITGMAVVQLFNRQQRNFRTFDELNKGLLVPNLRVTFYYAIFEPTVVLFNAVTTGVLIWYGGGRVLDDTLTLGTLVAFLQYMAWFYWPIRDLSERYTTIQQAMASSERIFAVLDEPEEITDAPDALPLPEIKGKIEFDHVWFAYDAENWVLRDVSFTIEPGDKVAIVGATGAGKTTMTALLNRFYDVQQGEIRVDGVPVRRLRQRELRRQVGVVLQDAFIFTDTVEENIRMRDESIDLTEVAAAAKLVGADSFIERMPDAYQTLLAERGANLSTGQKQLVALARVAVFDPKIVLVLDEATASIDPETEATLQHSIREVMRGRTSIIIAHRLNTIRYTNRILVLNQGRIVEEGSHEALLAARGTYYRLYELQYKDQDIGMTSPP